MRGKRIACILTSGGGNVYYAFIFECVKVLDDPNVWEFRSIERSAVPHRFIPDAIIKLHQFVNAKQVQNHDIVSEPIESNRPFTNPVFAFDLPEWHDPAQLPELIRAAVNY